MAKSGPGVLQVHKVYLVKVEQEDPFRVNLEEVYSVDHQTRVLQKELVSRTTNETDPTLITLRIRSALHDSLQTKNLL